MYLFYRTVQLRSGSVHEQLAWATAMTEKVNQISEAPATLWAPFGSPETNSLTWTLMLEDLATLEATGDKLLADSGYHMLLEQGSHHILDGTVEDGLLQQIYAEGTDPTPPAYVGIVESTIKPGCSMRAVEVGIEIAQRATRATGVPTTFSLGVTGRYGRVGWSVGYESIAQLQRANEAIQADATFTEYLDGHVGDVFVETAEQRIYRRLA